MTTTLAIEIAPFRLAAGTDEATLLEASERLEREFLSRADGYLGRSLSRLPDGRWADVVLWRSVEQAEAAMGRVSESHACSAYFGCMLSEDTADPANGVSLFRAIRTYGSLARQ